MKLADVSPTLNTLIPVATVFFNLIVKIAGMLLQIVRSQLQGFAYSALITARAKFLTITKRQSYYMPKNLGLLLGLVTPVSCAKSVKPEVDNNNNLIKEADKLYNDHSYIKLRDFLLQFKNEGNAEILWRLARATYEVGKLSSSPAEQKAMDLEAFNYVERAYFLDPNNFAVHKWMFILLDKKSSYEGLKQRISQSYIVKQHIERACELNPKDATSLHLLGYWCFSVAELPWYQRQIASTLFATPPESSYDEALKYFLQAEVVDPYFYSMNLLMIGKSYMRLDNKVKAATYLSRARDYPAATAEDAEVKQEAIKLLKSL